MYYLKYDFYLQDADLSRCMRSELINIFSFKQSNKL